MSRRNLSFFRLLASPLSPKAKNTRRSHSKSTLLRMESLEPRLALSGINLSFQIENTDYSASNVYVTFIGGTLSATYDNGHAVVTNHSYTISELNGPITLESYTNGRIFMSLGAGVAGDDPPEMVNPAIPSYSVRHDKIEITYSDADENSCANLTSVDFFGIPLEINTYQSGSTTPVDTLTYRIESDTLITQLAALAGNSSEVLLRDSGDFLRVLSPHTTTFSGTAHYPSMQPYIDAVKAWQTEGQPVHSYTTIDDLYTRDGDTPATQTQKYHFHATIEADGSLKLVGGGEKVGGSSWGGGDHTILVAAADLLDGIYLGNVAWTVDGVADSFANNDVYGAAVRDVLAGFNLGFMASATIDPETGAAFGQEASKYWWSSTEAFEYLQPNHTYYNQYAKIVTQNSDAYAWAFSDRWSHVQASLHGMETIEIVVLADTAPIMSPGLYDPTASKFYLRNSNTTGIADITLSYGAPGCGWTPLTGDWTGIGKQTVGLFNPATSTFYLRNSNTTGVADLTFNYGAPHNGWLPLSGDWTDSGKETVGLYDGSQSKFYLRNSNTTGIADTSFLYGQAGCGWTPLVGDWNGDGVETIGLYNYITSTFYLRNENTTGVADLTFNYGPAWSNWKPIVGDWDGDGVETIGLYDDGHGTVYLRNSNTTGVADITFNYGPPGALWKPLAGDWTGASSLMAADGVGAASSVAALAPADLPPILDEAKARWKAAGIDAALLAKLEQTRVIVGNLPGATLGQAIGNQIVLDNDAAGHGWFIDLTPGSDEEFASTSSGLSRAVDPRAVDRIDLLSVVEHELGHVLGLDDLTGLSNDVMGGLLSVGVRR